mmetsp:Transcript_27363/g.87679  ORF Transcript_27363/g.87679 Transcript_27363/m.87679 type:complete len:203 (+) Transcript_27363:1360-1968(+)
MSESTPMNVPTNLSSINPLRAPTVVRLLWSVLPSSKRKSFPCPLSSPASTARMESVTRADLKLNAFLPIELTFSFSFCSSASCCSLHFAISSSSFSLSISSIRRSLSSAYALASAFLRSLSARRAWTRSIADMASSDMARTWHRRRAATGTPGRAPSDAPCTPILCREARRAAAPLGPHGETIMVRLPPMNESLKLTRDDEV